MHARFLFQWETLTSANTSSIFENCLAQCLSNRTSDIPLQFWMQTYLRCRSRGSEDPLSGPACWFTFTSMYDSIEISKQSLAYPPRRVTYLNLYMSHIGITWLNQRCCRWLPAYTFLVSTLTFCSDYRVNLCCCAYCVRQGSGLNTAPVPHNIGAHWDP